MKYISRFAIGSNLPKGTLFTMERIISSYGEKLQQLKLKLKSEKESKGKLKRKLKIKMAEKITKLKEKLKTKKAVVPTTALLVRHLKKEVVKNTVTDKSATDKEIIDSASVDNIEFVENDIEMDSPTYEQQAINVSASNRQPEPNVIAENIIGDKFDIQYIHSYAKPKDVKPIRLHKCDHCGYETSKKYNLVKHLSCCRSEKILDVQCVQNRFHMMTCVHICDIMLPERIMQKIYMLHINHMSTKKCLTTSK